MACVILHRARGQFASAATLVVLTSLCAHQARAQAVVPQPVAPVAQPAWVNAAPTYQVGPSGAVNLDQPVVTYPMQYTAGQPVATYPQQPMMAQQPFVAQQPVMAPQPVAPYTPYAQPYAAQPWGTTAVQPQPAWGTPLVPTTALPGGPDPPFFVHRTSVFGEILYLRPRDAEVAFALPIDGPVAPVLGNEVPIGPVAVIDPDYDFGFRIGANVALDRGSSVRGSYTRYRSDTEQNATVTAPTVLRSLVTHPLGANVATDALDAAATLDYEFDRLALDCVSLLCGCECACAYAVNAVIGAEYATLDQEFTSVFAVPGTRTVNTEVNFEGVGMRLGLEGERFFPASGFFVYGDWITSFLFGEFDARFTQATALAGVEATTAYTAGRVVPVVELELGAGWLGFNRHLKLSAGYRLTSWFNMIKTDDWINAVQTADFRDMDGTVTFDGLVGRAEWLF